MKNVGGCWMCVYQNGSDYLLFAASMMCAHFNYKTPDRRAAAGWKSICRQFLSRLEFSPFPAIFAFTSLCLRQAGRRQPRHRDSCAARRQIRHSNHQVLSGSWFSPRRQYFTPWQPPAACMCWWCSDVSIIAEVQKRSGCQNILDSFIISAKKQLLWDNKVICLGGFILINHVHLFRCATLATETGRYMSDKINF